MKNLFQVMPELQEGCVAQVILSEYKWYIVNRKGFIRYCDKYGGNIGDTIKLTPSTLQAHYKIVKNAG